MQKPTIASMDIIEIGSRYRSLSDKRQWDDTCLLCLLPRLAHKLNKCREDSKPKTMEEWEQNNEFWEEYRKIMKEVMGMTDKGVVENIDQVERIEMILGEAMTKASGHVGEKNRTTKLTKPANVPMWPKEMKWAVYRKTLEGWIQQNADMTEDNRHQLISEALKNNKEVNGLSAYMIGHVMDELDTVDKQTVERLMGLIDKKYGKTRLEEVEELIM